jgi:hypothetical protein
LEQYFAKEKNIHICFASLLARSDKIYDEIRQSISEIMLREVTLKTVEREMQTEEKEYFTKCLVVALNKNENPFIRQNVT